MPRCAGDAADHVRAKGLWTNGYNVGVIREALQETIL